MNKNFYICIMAGGSGTRLWPMSRKNSPKQWQKFSSEKSLLQETFDRIQGLVPKANIFVSLTKDLVEGTEKELPDIEKGNFIIEPESKNTAPATGLVAAKIFRLNPNAIVATVASDHTIEKVDNFRKALLSQLNFIEKNPQYLAVIGIKPTRPDTGFGYIEVGKHLEADLFEGKKFVEKPDLKTAKKYLSSKKYLWNGCYFAWHAGELLKMYANYQPEIYKGLKNILKALGQSNEEEAVSREYELFPKVPVDTAIAEKHDRLAVVSVEMDWSDVGTWASLYEIIAKKIGETNVSKGHHIGVDDENCLFFAEDKLLATVGLKDIIVVDTPDATLVCNKNKSQDVKKLLEKLKEEGKAQYL